MRAKFVNEVKKPKIKHLTPKSKEELAKYPSPAMYLNQNKEEAKDIIREYLQDFLHSKVFDEEAYENSAMEGELIDTINGMMFGDDEGIMAEDDEANEYLNELVDEVLEEPNMEPIKIYFEQQNIEDNEDEMDIIDREYDD
jgi:hypothetical protein